jgi:protein-tyrosine phosphatase
MILFVCSGNLCRSPMAEYLFRFRDGRDLPWDCRSAGTMAAYDLPASAPSVIVLEELGIDLLPHRSQPVTADLVDAAALVVVMAAIHRVQVETRFPHAAGKVFLLRHFEPARPGGDIEDPIGLSVERYRRVRDRIAAGLPGLAAFASELEWNGNDA